MPFYNLIVALSGVKLPPTKGDCVVSPADGGPPLQGRPAGPVFFCGRPNFGNREVEGKGITMSTLSDTLSRTELNRTVADKTELAGAFDVTLKWITDPWTPYMTDWAVLQFRNQVRGHRSLLRSRNNLD